MLCLQLRPAVFLTEQLSMLKEMVSEAESVKTQADQWWAELDGARTRGERERIHRPGGRRAVALGSDLTQPGLCYVGKFHKNQTHS